MPCVKRTISSGAFGVKLRKFSAVDKVIEISTECQSLNSLAVDLLQITVQILAFHVSLTYLT